MERATNSSLILYTTEDGLTKIEATFDRDTVWLSIDQMADLFQIAAPAAHYFFTIHAYLLLLFSERKIVRKKPIRGFFRVQFQPAGDMVCIADHAPAKRKDTQMRVFSFCVIATL